MISKSLKEKIIPEQWKGLKIKSVYKKKGKEQNISNQRDIFITSIIGEVIENNIL